MFSINVSGLDDTIDERFEYNMDIASHYSGCGLIDDETGRLVSPMNYHLDKGTLLGIVQRQQEQITEDRKYFNLKIKSLENKVDAEDVVKGRLWSDEYSQEERATSTIVDEHYSAEEEIDDCEDCGEPREDCICEDKS